MSDDARLAIELAYAWAFEQAAKLVAQDKQVGPVIRFGQLRNGELVNRGKASPREFTDIQHKNAVAKICFAIVERPDIDVVVFVCETWLSSGDLPPGMTPEQDPLHTEGVCFWFYTKTLDTLVACPIDRGAKRLMQSDIDATPQIEQGRFRRPDRP